MTLWSLPGLVTATVWPYGHGCSCLVRHCSEFDLLFAALSMPHRSDVTFTVAGCDGNGRGGRFAGQASCRTGGWAQRFPSIIWAQWASRSLGQDLLLQPDKTQQERTVSISHRTDQNPHHSHTLLAWRLHAARRAGDLADGQPWHSAQGTAMQITGKIPTLHKRLFAKLKV